MKNRYEIRGELTAIYLTRKTGEVLETIIDTKNLDRAVEITGSWYSSYSKSQDVYYVCGHHKGKKVKLHRWIMNTPVGYEVDHINGNPLINTENNMRNVTHKENLQNLSRVQRNNKSGYRGVFYAKELNRYIAYVTIDGKRKHLGCFNTAELANDAVTAYRSIHMSSIESENVSYSEMENRIDKKCKRSKSSQFVGVYWDKRANKWCAHITVNGKTKKIGLYDNEMTASIAHDIHEFNHRGANGRFNHPDIFHSSTATWSTVDNFTSHTVDAHVV